MHSFTKWFTALWWNDSRGHTHLGAVLLFFGAIVGSCDGDVIINTEDWTLVQVLHYMADDKGMGAKNTLVGGAVKFMGPPMTCAN